MNPDIEQLLNKAVKDSLGYDPIKESKYSIIPCSENQFLDPEYDPFQLLEFTLMAHTIREKYGFTGEESEGLL